MSDSATPIDDNEVQKYLNDLSSEISRSKDLKTKLNDKNQEIFDKETKYFGYLNDSGNGNQTGSNTLSNFQYRQVEEQRIMTTMKDPATTVMVT